MRISYNWLKQFIKIDWKSDETAALLTDLGLEVEGIEKYDILLRTHADELFELGYNSTKNKLNK